MKKAKKLSERIEKVRSTREESEWLRSKKTFDTRSSQIPSATEDRDLSSYVQGFVQEIETLSPLPQADLMTPEKARAAVYMLDQKLAQIEKFRKTAVALKSLLLSRDSEGKIN